MIYPISEVRFCAQL